MNKMTARFSSKLLSWLLVLAMALFLLPTAALAEDKQDPPIQILKCETNYGYDFKLTFSSEFSDWLLSVKSVTVANTSYTKVDSSYGVWNDTDYYIGGDYLLIGEGFTGNSATCVIEAEGYRALTLTLDKTTHSAEIVSAQEPETGGDSENGNGSSEDEGKEPEQGDATSAVTVPEFSNIKNSYYILAFQTQDYVSGISNVLVNSQECQQGISATFLSGTQYYKNAAENKLYLANTQWGSDPTFQNGDIITIQNSSYQDLVLKVTIAGDTVNIGPNDGGDEDEYILHVRLVGSFEAALVGQEDYDAVSSASTNVTTNKNSNVEVQGALIQGDEPDNSDWKPLNQLGITVDKNTTSVSISPNGSGMVGVYSTYDSSLTLAGTPKTAGSYEISVTVSDGQGRTAASNKLPFNVYSGNETLADRLTLENCTQTSDGKYMWDMEPWAISDFGGTDDTVTVPEGLKAWYGSHTSGTYGKLGYAVSNDTAPTQTLIVPDGCNLTLVNMDVLSSVKIVVQDGGKLVLRDSVIQGVVEVNGGGAFSMNYNDYGEGTYESGASINGQLILNNGATLENASIYSNTNNIANGNVARHNTSPVVVVNGSVSIKGNVFIRGDEAASGMDETTGKSYSGQPALQVNGTLTIPEGSILAAYGGGMNATTSVGGDAVILGNGTITGGGKLIAVGGDGEYDDGGDAVTGTGAISTREAFLQGGSTFQPKDGSAPGQAAADGVTVADTTKAVLKDGISYTNTTDDPNTPHWTGTEAPDEELLSKYGVATYVLMNIPYADFYAAEAVEDDTLSGVDAISSATKSKTMNASLAAGSYHVNHDGTDITGVIYPVYVADSSVLSGCTKADSEDDLFCNASYAYCTLNETPVSYKELTVKNSIKSFGKATGTVEIVSGASATLSTDDHHVDYAITVKGLDAVTADNVSGVTLHTTDKNIYGLRHVYEIWRGTSLGFNISGDNGDYAALVGKTIDKITYYLNDGKILTFDTNLTVPTLAGITAAVASVDAGTTSTTFTLSGTLPQGFDPAYSVNLEGATVNAESKAITLPTNAAFGSYKLTITDQSGQYAPVTASFALYGYVLMNIPYGEFYAAEKNSTEDTVNGVDAVSSATKSKPLSSLAAGSYHVNDDGSDITGVIYPVQISDASVLNGYTKVTDADSITYTVNLRGQMTTTTYTGKDALFGKPSYSYYVLDEKPASYKALTVRRGAKSFGAAMGTAEVLSGASATLSTDDRHVDVAIKVTDESGTIQANNVSGVTLHTTDNNVYGLRHVYEIWRGTELGFDIAGNYAALAGKTIDKITYYLNDGKIRTISVDLAVPAFTTNTITVDGTAYDRVGLSAVTFDDISSLTDKTLFPAGADDAYLVTIGAETKLLGDTTLKRWVGTWENWQPWTSADDAVKAAMDARYPLINDVWELAYPAYINAFKGTALESMIQTMYPNVDSLKAYWYNMTDTKGVASIQVTEEEDGSYKLSWLNNTGTVLASDSYTMTGKVLNGLEGATMYVFTADNLEETSNYKYLVTMEPDMEGEEEAPIAAHYHFQFGSDLNGILVYGEYHNAIEKNETTGRAVSDMKDGKWYATMINANASDLAKYNVVLAMHRADKFSTADDVLLGIAGESGTTYMPLFDCILKDEYNSYWHDYCAAVAGDNGNLAQLVEYLQQSCNGTVYGQEGLTQYCCDFINGAESITINGNRITVKDSAGNTISDSEYTYQGPVTIGDPNTLYHFTAYLYRAVDFRVSENFRYFLFRDDAPDTTYHIEFRYGSNLDALKGLITGEYAYWLASGIPVNADETMIENCIALFCLENQDYSAERSSESVAQIADFVGTWDYSADGGKTTSPDLLHFTVDSKGNGTSYYNNEVSSQYQVFAYDNDGSSAAKSGIYIAFNGEEFTWADYDITVSDGNTILTFTGYEDGQPYTLTYVKHQSGGGTGGGSSSSGSSSSGSSSSGSSSSSSAGGSSSSSSNTTTTKNPDGSTTTTTTDKKTGTVTETTKTTDGTTGTVVTNKDGDVTEVKATLSSAAVTEAAKIGEAVTLPVEVPTAKSTEDAPAVQVSVPKSAGSVKVEIPVEKVTPGTVAVIVKADGTEEIVKTSIPTENGVALTVEGDVTVKIIDNSKEFADVHDANHWATDSIDFVTSRELFTGKTEDSFAPNAPTTRAQLMTVLARLDGVDTSTAPLQKGMEWAVENGISDGTNPGGNISRQQLAVMLWRYAGSPASSKALTNPDAASVSDYAQAAMQWAVENGIMNGDTNGNLNPQGIASRAHVATMVARYCEKLA